MYHHRCSLMQNITNYSMGQCIVQVSWTHVPKTILIALDQQQNQKDSATHSKSENSPLTTSADSKKPKNVKITADEQLLRQLNKLKLANRQFMTIEEMSVMLIKPPIVDINHKYPLLLYLDSHPEDQSVTTQWDFSYLDYIASTHKIFVAQVDTRGSQGYSVGFLTANNQQSTQSTSAAGGRPGDAEAKGVKKILETLVENDVADPKSIAILASEYGAYIGMEANKIRGGDLNIQCMAMVRPVTNLSNCDAFTAQAKLSQSRSSYSDSSPESASTFTDNLVFKERSEALRGVSTPVLLVGALADHTPVLFEQTAQLINQLTNTHIPFQSQIYTTLESNTDRGVLENSHVIQELTTYLTRCLQHNTVSEEDEEEAGEECE